MHSCHWPGLLLVASTLLTFSLFHLTHTVEGRLIASHSLALINAWTRELFPAPNRVYGSLLPPVPADQLWKPPAENETPPSSALGNGSCGGRVAVADGSYYDFIITPTVKFCAVLVEPVDNSSKVRVAPTLMNLRSCEDEYLHLTWPDQKSFTVCGGPVPVAVHDSYLILQYERRAPTPSEFTIRVWAHKPRPAFAGRSLDRSTMTSRTEEIQICPEVCGRPPHVRRGRILGGTTARPGEFPWMAQLVTIRNSTVVGGAPDIKVCGASILDRRHILTAAHCIRNPFVRTDPDRMEVIVGTNSPATVLSTQPDPLAVTVGADRWFRIYPPHISRLWTTSYDISVVRLVTALNFTERIAPVCLAPDGDYTNSDVLVSGFGDGANGTAHAELQKMQVTVRSNAACLQEYRRFWPNHPIGQHEMCMFAPSRDNCAGDSGGPAVFNRDGRIYQVGVVSYGLACNATKNETTHHGVYTRVPQFLGWIRNSIGAHANCS